MSIKRGHNLDLQPSDYLMDDDKRALFNQYMNLDKSLTERRAAIDPKLMLTIQNDELYNEYEELRYDLEQSRLLIRTGKNPVLSTQELESRIGLFLVKLAQSGK